MSFKVHLHTLSKRDNSTKQPSTTGTEFSCVLKSGCGIIRPVISLDLGVGSDPSQYNYAYIPAFDRYYFIEEWFYERALWTASLRVDVLATYKTAIGGSSLYILRAAGAHNGDIIDTLYPAKTGCSYNTVTVTNPWWNNITFVVGVVSRSANMGSLSYFAMNASNIQTMCSNLLDKSYIITEPHGFNLTEISEALQLSLVDPIQYVKSCMAIPIDYNTEASALGSVDAVYAYSWDTQAVGYRIAQAPYVNKSFTFSITKHPDTTARGNYVNSAPYTNITLTMPPFGTIQIDTSVTCNASTLYADVRLDPISGNAVLTVTCNGVVLNRVETQLGVPVSLSSVTRDYTGAVSSILGTVGGAAGAALSGNIGGVIGAASGIGDAVHSLVPRATTVGSSGGFALGMGNFRLDHQFFRPIDDDNTHNGRPLCDVRQINTLSGYMLVQDGDVTTNGTASEDRQIRQYLESGFYYE